MAIKYDNCKDCQSGCEHAGKNREFVCIKGVSCKETNTKVHDMVEVVRCKDCVHIKNIYNARYCTIWCMFNGMGDDGFCNYGMRKTE